MSHRNTTQAQPFVKPLQLETETILEAENVGPGVHASRVIRMYQDQAWHLSADEQKDYLHCVENCEYYKLDARSEKDPRRHPICTNYLSKALAPGPLPRSRWLILEALYNDKQLDALVASSGVGPRPALPAPRYETYRKHYPAEDCADDELEPLFHLPLRDPRFCFVRDQRIQDQRSQRERRSYSQPGRDHDEEGEENEEAQGDCDEDPVTKASSKHNRGQGDAKQLQLLQKVSDDVESMAKHITTNEEVLQFLMQQIQQLEKQNEALSAKIEDLEKQVDTASTLTAETSQRPELHGRAKRRAIEY